MTDVLVSGVRLPVAATDVSWTERWGTGACGPLEASWRLDLPPNVTVPAVRRGAVVRLLDSATTVFGGILSEPTKTLDGWQCTARGFARLAEDYPALDSNGAPTTRVDVAVNQAIASGWPVQLAPGLVLPSTPVAAQDTGQINTVYDLLTAYVESTGQRWGATERGDLFFATDSTTPRWVLGPGVLLPGTMDEEWYSVVVLRYADSATNPATVKPIVRTNAAALARWGYRAKVIDRTGLGPMSSSAAGLLAQSIVDQLGPRMGWDADLTLTSSMVRTLTGVQARLPLIRAGDLMRGTGWADVQGTTTPTPSTNLIVGEVQHRDGSDSLPVKPLGRVDRGLDALTADSVATEEQIANNFKEAVVTG